MKIKHKKILLFLLGIIVIYLLVTILTALMANIDYNRVKKGKEPIFTGSRIGYADGGSGDYYSVLYLITDINGYSNHTPRPEWAHGDSWAYDEGVSLAYRFPYLCPWWNNKVEFETVINEEHKAIYYMNTQQKNPGD